MRVAALFRGNFGHLKITVGNGFQEGHNHETHPIKCRLNGTSLAQQTTGIIYRLTIARHDVEQSFIAGENDKVGGSTRCA